MSWTLVTGGGKRLGAEICLKLASEGYDVVIHYRNSRTEAKDIARQCRDKGVEAETIQGDFSDKESTVLFVQKYLKRFSDTQNLINNVGSYLVSSSLLTPLDLWYELFQTNLHAPMILIQNLAPSLKKNRGSIVNIGIAGINSSRTDTYSTAYTCSKTALWMLTKSLALELAAYQVKVNMVSPGYLDIAVDLPKDMRGLPMNRAATSQEVAHVIAFLLKKESVYITGQNIEVAGGVRL
jgi:NAD(P)-dependent dehydrogenase (short-subunit alcohol dehydrogenase family)